MKLLAVAAHSLVACAILSTPASAALVSFFLKQDTVAGTWQLSTRASRGDNAGIATYGVSLIGSITSLDHKSPRAGAAENADASLSGPVGFTVFRSPDGAANTKIGGGQDSLAPTPFLIYGFGQTAGSFQTVTNGPAIPLGSNEGNSWLARPVIASGTMTPGTMVKIDYSAFTLVNVFKDFGSPATMSAQVCNPEWWGDICNCPEPSTACMAALSVVSGVAARRRFPKPAR